MPAPNTISVEKLARLVGTPNAPILIDLSTSETHFLPAALKRLSNDEVLAATANRPVVVACDDGRTDSPGVAAWLRHEGAAAEHLEGGVAAWRAAALPLIDESKLPRRDDRRRTLWVTRARPKVDRIACPWLVRRFVDPDAVFLFVAPSEIAGVAEKFEATPFDMEGAFWSHRGSLCTFDVMVEELGLGSIPALERLSAIVRGADTGHPEIAAQAAGLLAVSLGLSRMYADDLRQLDAGMLIYDALFRWCRDAVDETHDWVSHTASGKARS